jgi:hypothetical protein
MHTLYEHGCGARYLCGFFGIMQVALNSSRPRIAAALRQLDADISAGLEAFDYVPDSPLGKDCWG